MDYTCEWGTIINGTTVLYSMQSTTSNETWAARSCGRRRDFSLRPSQGGRGGRVDLVISEPPRGHTFLDVVIADPTRVDLVARAGDVPHHAASEASLHWATARRLLHSYRHRDI